jgi:hypothetical protein
LLIAAIEFAGTRGSVQYSVLEQLAWLARLALHWGLAALPVGVALFEAERRAFDGAPSTVGYVVAVLTGAITGAGVMALHGKFVDPAITQTAIGTDLALTDRFLYGFWQLTFWGSAGAAYHAADLRHKGGAAALRRGELARLRSERGLSTVRLAAMHAQVEPEFVLATLDTVERLYTRDLAAADRVLDALIQFLREATPQLRRQSSTIDQECRLLQLYLRALGAASEQVEDVRVVADPATRDLGLPPGILVSLAQQLLAALPAGAARFEVHSTRRDECVSLDISATATALECTPALREFVVRAGERLRMSQGPRGEITLLQEATGRLTLRITLIDRQGDDHDGTIGH